MIAVNANMKNTYNTGVIMRAITPLECAVHYRVYTAGLLFSTQGGCNQEIISCTCLGAAVNEGDCVRKRCRGVHVIKCRILMYVKSLFVASSLTLVHDHLVTYLLLKVNRDAGAWKKKVMSSNSPSPLERYIDIYLSCSFVKLQSPAM